MVPCFAREPNLDGRRCAADARRFRSLGGAAFGHGYRDEFAALLSTPVPGVDLSDMN